MWSKILTLSSYNVQLWKKFRVYLLLSSLIFLAFVSFSDADDVNIRLLQSLEVYDKIAFNNGALNSSYYNSSCINLMYTHGFNGKPDGNTTNTSLNGMLYYKNNVCCANVFLLDWSELAGTPNGTGEYETKLLYASKAVPAAVATGKRLAELLLYWANNFGFNIACLHLIGHSLGAHLFGYTGRRIDETGNGIKIYKITGLDCAGALFGNTSLYLRLDITCATCVVVIHSDPTSTPETSKRLGINETAGYDIWLNYYTSEDQVQPGCLKGEQQFMSNAALCSHNRAPVVYALTWYYQTCCLTCLNGTIRQNQTVCQNETESQTVGQNQTESQTLTFQASRAPNYYAWVAGNGSSSVIILGACTNCNARGNYYLTTTGLYPYAKGAAGAYPP